MYRGVNMTADKLTYFLFCFPWFLDDLRRWKWPWCPEKWLEPSEARIHNPSIIRPRKLFVCYSLVQVQYYHKLALHLVQFCNLSNSMFITYSYIFLYMWFLHKPLCENVKKNEKDYVLLHFIQSFLCSAICMWHLNSDKTPWLSSRGSSLN